MLSSWGSWGRNSAAGNNVDHHNVYFEEGDKRPWYPKEDQSQSSQPSPVSTSSRPKEYREITSALFSPMTKKPHVRPTSFDPPSSQASASVGSATPHTPSDQRKKTAVRQTLRRYQASLTFPNTISLNKCNTGPTSAYDVAMLYKL